jgi:hypothetical protein
LVIFAALLALRVADLLPQSSTGTPHPFWIPVILVSTAYGTGPGLFAALAASGLKRLLEGEPMSPHLDYYSWFLTSWSDPLLWLVAALVVGEVRRRHLDKASALAAMARDAEAERHSIAKYCGELREYIAHLEHRLAAHQPLAERAIRAFIAIERAPAADAVQLGAEFASNLVSSSAVHVVLLDKGRWRVAAIALQARRHCDGFRLPDEGSLDNIARRARLLRANEQEDLAVLGSGLAAAVPLRAASGDVFGLILLHDIDFAAMEELGEAGLSHFASVLAARLVARHTPDIGPALRSRTGGNAAVGTT